MSRSVRISNDINEATKVQEKENLQSPKGFEGLVKSVLPPSHFVSPISYGQLVFRYVSLIYCGRKVLHASIDVKVTHHIDSYEYTYQLCRVETTSYHFPIPTCFFWKRPDHTSRCLRHSLCRREARHAPTIPTPCRTPQRWRRVWEESQWGAKRPVLQGFSLVNDVKSIEYRWFERCSSRLLA